MALLSQTLYFNDQLVAPTDAELAQIALMVNPLIQGVKPTWVAELANAPRTLSLPIADATASASAYSVTFPVDLKIKVVAVVLGCVAAAGATGTMDLEYSTDSGSTWVSMLDAAKDVKTDAGEGAKYAIDTAKVDLNPGAWIRAKAASGSGGPLSGGVAHVDWVRR